VERSERIIRWSCPTLVAPAVMTKIFSSRKIYEYYLHRVGGP